MKIKNFIMYNSNSGKLLNSRNLSSFNFVSKSFNGLFKTPFDSVNYNQLPVIKEEEGCLSDEESVTCYADKPLQDPCQRKSCSKKGSPPSCESGVSPGSRYQLEPSKTFTKLPPIVNVNCLMNVDLKQSHHIWDTNFGKRLILGKHDNLNTLDQIDSSGSVEDEGKRPPEKSDVGRPSKLTSKQKSIAEQYVRNGGGDTAGSGAQKKNSRKKTKISKASKNASKKFCGNKDSEKDSLTTSEAKSNEKLGQPFPQKEKAPSKNTLNAQQLSNKALETGSNTNSFSKGRHFLTECVRSILDNTPGPLECEHCNEEFANIEDLCQHKKEHESKKETCLLCGKVFYNPNEFVQHLLSHEGVDRFSCKKCRKYFPSLRKYKQHCREFHSTQQKPPSAPSQNSVDYVKRWLQKYDCKRCHAEFGSEKLLEEHKRDHIKMDLAGAYLLSPSHLSQA